MEQQTIKCAFCKGTGENLYFKGTCPVCKGKGKNQITGKYMACGDCRSSGQKRGTTLTCYTCAGLGVIPDTREELRRARQEIRKVQGEMEEERLELAGRQPKVDRKASVDEDTEEGWQTAQDSEHTRFCQSCAKSTKNDDLIKVCLECFKKIKQGSL
ncbi:MAG: hypothetical protein Q8L01_01455 [Candidatus Woesebacteria bacterium]|nr:hypothetical protein [Candidatus Woesebacteria bacterium]